MTKQFTAIFINRQCNFEMTQMRYIEQKENETVRDMLIREEIENSTIFLFNGHPILKGTEHTVVSVNKFLSVDEAANQRCCRICKEIDHPGNELGPFVFSYGEEYAHEKCIATESPESKMFYIESQLKRSQKWTRSNYQEFFNSNIEFLLPFAKSATVFEQPIVDFVNRMIDQLDPEMSSRDIREIRELFIRAKYRLEE